MALTKHEALIRVGAIWGEDDGSVEPKEGGGCFFIEKTGNVHRLDGNGHPTCHKNCVELETIAYNRGLLK